MDILSRTFSLVAITSVFALTACSSDDPPVNEQLSFQADFADVVSMRAVGEDLLFTAGSSLYRLDSSGEYSLEISAATTGRAFVEVLGQDHYILVNADRRGFRETKDGGATWSVDFLDRDDRNFQLNGLNMIDDRLFVRLPEALLETNPDLPNLEVISGNIEPGGDPRYGLYSVIYSQQNDQLWWSERDSAFVDTWNLKRLDLETNEIGVFREAGEHRINDGFVDQDNPSMLVFGGVGGIMLSYNNGETWERVQPVATEGETVEVNSVKQDSVSGYYYANVSLHEVARVNEMWCSRDQGETWTRTELSSGTYGRTEARRPMMITERGGERRFVIPTRRGIVEGRLGLIDCG